MSDAKYTSEVKYEIWNYDDGDRFDVGPDRDGLDLIEIRYVDHDGKIGDRLVMPKAAAKLVAEALLKVIG